jgi:hypothetical protein
MASKQLADVADILHNLHDRVTKLESAASVKSLVILKPHSLGYGIDTMVKARSLMNDIARSFNYDATEKYDRFHNYHAIANTFNRQGGWFRVLSNADKRDIMKYLNISQHNNGIYYYHNVLALIIMQLYYQIRPIIPDQDIANCIVQTVIAQYGSGSEESKQAIERAVEMIKSGITDRIASLVAGSNSFTDPRMKAFIVDLLGESFRIKISVSRKPSTSGDESESSSDEGESNGSDPLERRMRYNLIHPRHNSIEPNNPYDSSLTI